MRIKYIFQETSSQYPFQPLKLFLETEFKTKIFKNGTLNKIKLKKALEIENQMLAETEELNAEWNLTLKFTLK